MRASACLVSAASQRFGKPPRKRRSLVPRLSTRLIEQIETVSEPAEGPMVRRPGRTAGRALELRQGKILVGPDAESRGDERHDGICR